MKLYAITNYENFRLEKLKKEQSKQTKYGIRLISNK